MSDGRLMHGAAARRASWPLRSLALAVLASCDLLSTEASRHAAPASDPTGGQWATWVLVNGAAVRPAPPPAPGSALAKQEVDEILALQNGIDAAGKSRIEQWDGLPSVLWTDVALERLAFYWPLLPDVRLATPVRSTRIMSLLHVAMYDAMVAAWDAKFAYRRVAPALADSRVQALVQLSDLPSYPSEHAAAAAAAALVLAYVFPLDDSSNFAAMARTAAETRIAAGANYRSDVEAGLALGTTVAARVLARARADGADGADAPSSGGIPSGPYLWKPTPPRRVAAPFDPGAGGWRTWVLTSGNQFRPTPPPLPGSATFDENLAELQHLSTSRTTAQADTARYWASEAPSARWEVFMQDELRERRFTPLRAARAQALASVSSYDALVACWDAKFFYWLERPITADPNIVTVFATPPFPSYPSGHSTQSAAMAEVFAELFPDSASAYHAKANAASVSRVLAGIHYRFDIMAGEQLGKKVGEAVVSRARSDGSSP